MAYVSNSNIQRTRPATAGNQSLGSEVVTFATNVAKNRPVTVSLWALGLMVAALGNGFSVTTERLEMYQESMDHAAHVHDKDLGQARRLLNDASQKYYNSKGWFWSCDAVCTKNYTKLQLAESRLAEVEQKVGGTGAEPLGRGGAYEPPRRGGAEGRM